MVWKFNPFSGAMDEVGSSSSGAATSNTFTDPATNAATADANLVLYSTIILTTTGTSNAQAISGTSALPVGTIRTILVHPGSSDGFTITNAGINGPITLAAGQACQFVYFGGNWIRINEPAI